MKTIGDDRASVEPENFMSSNDGIEGSKSSVIHINRFGRHAKFHKGIAHCCWLVVIDCPVVATYKHLANSLPMANLAHATVSHGLSQDDSKCFS